MIESLIGMSIIGLTFSLGLSYLIGIKKWQTRQYIQNKTD